MRWGSQVALWVKDSPSPRRLESAFGVLDVGFDAFVMALLVLGVHHLIRVRLSVGAADG